MKAFVVRVFGRRAVSGAITGMFVVLIFVAAISALLAYSTSQDRYNRAVSERNQMEWERLNEKILIPSAERLEDSTLNATVRNFGAVTAHLVSLWLSAYDVNNDPQWQRQYTIDVWVSPGETKTNLGQAGYSYTLIKGNAGEAQPTIKLPGEDWAYTIKLVTERGNVAIYVLQPPEEEEEVEVPAPRIVYSPGTMKINYENPNDESKWCPPYINDESLHEHVSQGKLYVRATFLNNWDRPITIKWGSVLFQICVGPSNNKVISFGGYWYGGPATWNPGEEIQIVYKIDTYTWGENRALEDLFTDQITAVTFTGSAAFSSDIPRPGGEFFSAAVLMDGLLVYDIDK
ncbi:hypothetical protein KEJ44_09135 [Candidatus Bathyarchaeota archaeon]|nr:hypothetical protein [Candidatus Bathyarchaeota archaeon]